MTDERLRAEFEEWNATVTPCATIALQEAARENYCFPDLEMCVKAERDRAYRAAAEKRDGRYAGLVEAARGWMAVKWTVVNEEDGPVSMSLDEWARLRADLRTALAAPPEEE